MRILDFSKIRMWVTLGPASEYFETDSMRREPIADYLRRRLAEQEGNHSRIADETGVSQSTVSRIYLGVCDPTLKTVQPLLDWFHGQDQLRAGRRRGRPSARGIPNAGGVRVTRRTAAPPTF